MRGLLRGHAARGGTVLLSSHLLGEVEHTVDRLLVIGGGRIVADGPVASLLGSDGVSVRSADAAPRWRADLAAGLLRRARGRRRAGRLRCLAGRRRRRRGGRRSRAHRTPAAAARPGGRLLLPHRGLSRTHSHSGGSPHDCSSCFPCPVPSPPAGPVRHCPPAGRAGGAQVALHPVGAGRWSPPRPCWRRPRWRSRPARASEHLDNVLGPLVVTGMLTALVLLSLGVLSTAGEWSHGTVQTTYLLEPRRGRVMAAKAAGGGRDGRGGRRGGGRALGAACWSRWSRRRRGTASGGRC